MEYWMAYLDQALIYSMFAMSLNILIGYSGIFSVGSAAFGAIGGYFTAALTLHMGWNPVPAILVSILVGGLVAMLLSVPVLRLASEYVMLMTLSLSILVLTIVSSSTWLGGASGLVGVPELELFGIAIFKPSQFVPLLAVAMLAVGFVCWRIGESPFGRLLRGARDDELGVRSLGRSPFWPRVLTFSLMCAITSFCGAILSLYNGVASPQLFSLDQTLLIFAMVIVGGLSSVPGSILGAFLIVGVSPVMERAFRLSADESALLRPIIFGVLLVLIVRFRPQGILAERIRLPRPSNPDVAISGEAQSHLAREGSVVEIRDLRKAFGGVVAVEGLTLTLRPGQITALVGANGAGKSTVFNLITGAITPDAGQVLLDGNEITKMSPERVAQRGMVRSFQDLRIFANLTPLENVMLAKRNSSGENLVGLFLRPLAVRKRERELVAEARAWLEFVGVDPDLRVKAESLSFAQQKQVAFARVLATDAQVFLLDEPLSGIEGSAVEEMLALIEKVRASGRTICVVEHSIEAIQRLADWGYFMETGKVTAEGTIHDLLNDPRLAEVYFGDIKGH